LPKQKKVPLRSELLAGDCVKGMDYLEPGSVDLIVADSPYNYGQAYDAYDDNQPEEKFLGWVQTWIASATRVLNKHGSMWIFAPDEWVSEVDVYCRHRMHLYKRSHVVWFYTFGQSCAKNFARSHTHLLYYTKTKSKFTFNADDKQVRVPSARQLVYKDKRQNPKGKLPDNTWMLLKGEMDQVFQPDMDTWLVNRVCGTYLERAKHSPNQLPYSLIERIVLSTSSPGQLVVDPFLGSGVTGQVCKHHGRHFLGYDISKECVKQARRRIDAPPPKGKT
jgi:site-specific DNA-methyltransferase (adenine-specific)